MNLFILDYLMKYFHKNISLILTLYQNLQELISDNKYFQMLKFLLKDLYQNIKKKIIQLLLIYKINYELTSLFNQKKFNSYQPHFLSNTYS